MLDEWCRHVKLEVNYAHVEAKDMTVQETEKMGYLKPYRKSVKSEDLGSHQLGKLNRYREILEREAQG